MSKNKKRPASTSNWLKTRSYPRSGGWKQDISGILIHKSGCKPLQELSSCSQNKNCWRSTEQLKSCISSSGPCWLVLLRSSASEQSSGACSKSCSSVEKGTNIWRMVGAAGARNDSSSVAPASRNTKNRRKDNIESCKDNKYLGASATGCAGRIVSF